MAFNPMMQQLLAMYMQGGQPGPQGPQGGVPGMPGGTGAPPQGQGPQDTYSRLLNNPSLLAHMTQYKLAENKDTQNESDLAEGEGLRKDMGHQGYGMLGGVGAGLTNALNGLHSGILTRSAKKGLKDNMAVKQAVIDHLFKSIGEPSVFGDINGTGNQPYGDANGGAI